MAEPLRAVAINCTLKTGPESSSTDVILTEVLAELREHDVETGTIVRAVDHDIRPGVTSDEGAGDAWPAIRRQVLDADILVLGTPIWLGQPSSVAHRVLERMDAFLGEADDDGRMITFDKVAIVAVVGNEDGAHHVSAELFQALNDVGFTVPANGATYWVGEAMRGIDYKDLEHRPRTTHGTNATVARHAAHLARLLRGDPYPAG